MRAKRLWVNCLQASSLGFNLCAQLLKKKECVRIIHHFLNDLITSGYLLILGYFLFCLFFNLIVLSRPPDDPSIESNKNYVKMLCSIAGQKRGNRSNLVNHEKGFESNHELMTLLKFVNITLLKTNKSFFLCYRSLYDALRLKVKFHHKNIVDICVHEKEQDSIFDAFVKTDFEIMLTENKESFSFEYTYNRMCGYYHITSKVSDVNIFIYLFVTAAATKYEFATIRRYGHFYSKFRADEIMEIGDFGRRLRKNLYQVKMKEHNIHFFADKHQLNKPMNIPGYMVENMNNKILIGNEHLPIPNDPDLVLMYFYPDSWFITYPYCMI